jgi:2-polyprenyl-3-methyl-5-hydroxy-6-metoxy-1,4-benzoquinol methylase
MPTAQALDAYYESYYSMEDRGAAHVTVDDVNVLTRRISSYVAAQRGGRRVANILDLGGGDGTVSLALARDLTSSLGAPPSVTVVDYEADVATPASGVELRRARDLGEVSDAFDIVLASAVLEHLPDPMAELELLTDRLGVGGMLYVRTPAVASMIALAARLGVRIDFTFPGHLHDFGQQFWETVPTWWPPCMEGTVRLVASRPSPVETALRAHTARTVVAHLMKAPWWILRSHYTMVGGWEAVFVRTF